MLSEISVIAKALKLAAREQKKRTDVMPFCGDLVIHVSRYRVWQFTYLL